MKDTGSQAQSHEIWCDYLRCIAMSMVIALHASGLWLTGPMSSVDWRIANAVNSACRPSVPFFFMISGYLLCRSKPMSFPAYARKRITRIALAFFIATGFALIYRIFTGEHLGVASSWEWISTPQFYHLWFFYTIAFVYVGLWIMRPNGVNPVTGTIACFAVIFILDRRGESFAAFLLYAMAGYFIGIAPRSKRTAMLFVPVGVIMLAIVYAETASISSKAGHLDQTWYRYTSTPVAAASFLLFYSIRNLLSTPPISAIIQHISSASLFIYCAHPFLIDYFIRIHPELIKIGANFGILILVFGSVFFLMAVRYLGKILLPLRPTKIII
ncbi:acyltransferase [Burkholderia ubonensis]|uniref:acyltransferase n=1 Tax=Burkholderia ubonensis TaxID=101571 RepID=UPI0009B41457|nr:acyltransferase family protein [Burkholderia ubonensis]